jgi:hypothetical protein
MDILEVEQKERLSCEEVAPRLSGLPTSRRLALALFVAPSKAPHRGALVVSGALRRQGGTFAWPPPAGMVPSGR